MKRLIQKVMQFFRVSLTRSLTLFVALMATAVFLVALAFMFAQSRYAVRQEAMSNANQLLDNSLQRINAILERTEAATNNTLWLVKRHLNTPDSMFVYSRGIVESNPFLNGCSIAFEPYYFEEKGLYFSAYSGMIADRIETRQEGNDEYEYFYMDWYALSKLLDRAAWTEPYINIDTYEDNVEREEVSTIVSYCVPIKDPEGNFVGAIATDLSLDWLSNTISAVKPYPNSYSVMISRNGTFFVHPDPSKLLYESIFTETLENDDPQRMEIGLAMVNGEEGVHKAKVDGEHYYIFYKPIGNTGFSAAIVCPEKDIFSNLNRLRNSVIAIFLAGMLLMLFILDRIIRRQLKPLKSLAAQTETIAAGEFDKSLPNVGRVDEIGRLYQSFGNMQQSLVNYIEEMKITTAAHASMENELKVASNIQMSMVPRIFPAFPEREDIDLYACMTPAKDVGGDLYDFFIENECLYFCIGDVSGKGVPASLFMAVTRNIFRIIAQQGYSPEIIASKINHTLSADNDQEMFVTMFIGKIDLASGQMDFCNCGHNPPVVHIPGKSADFLPVKNVNAPLGIMDSLSFKGETVADVRRWQILFYTDGLNEAENPDFELFGNDRLLAIMDKLGNCSSADTIKQLQEAVEKHRAGAAPSDDLTLLCLKLK